MTRVGAEEGILPGLLGCNEAEGLHGVLFEKPGVVEDSFVLGNEAELGGLGVCSHAVGSFSDFLQGCALVENEEIVLGDIWIGEVEANGLACFHREFFFGEKKSLGDAGDFDGLEILLGVKGGFGGASGGGLEPVGLFEISENFGDDGSVRGILPVGFESRRVERGADGISEVGVGCLFENGCDSLDQ